jgi:hypothetical protein
MLPMLLVLPASCFVLIVLNLLSAGGPDASIRSVLLRATVVWGSVLVVITEILSWFRGLTVDGLAISWAVLTTVSAAYLARRRIGLPDLKLRWPGLLPVAMMLLIVVVVLGTGLIAAFGWSSQWDSMVYHLSRVDHWIQNQTVGFYPTHIIRQLYNPPGAEYAILHFQVLGGDERWSHAAQWLSMFGSILGVSEIARLLGASSAGQLFSAAFAATLPMGILQAPGTQNDYVTTLWLVCMTESALAPPSRARSFQTGASLGLAILSKGTALIFAGPLLLSMPHLTTGSWGMRLRRAVPIALTALMLNLPHWTRNLDTFGTPLGPAKLGSADARNDQLTNEAISPEILLSNVVRNLGLHVGTTSTRVNRALTSAVVRGHAWLGLSVTDQRSTRLDPKTQYEIVGKPNDPDRTGNPLHLVLILLTICRIAISKTLRRRPYLARFGAGLGAAFLLFCLLLKWQPWNSRLHLPLFVLASPLVGLTWGTVPGMMWVTTILLAAGAIPSLLRNKLAPLVGRHTIFDTPSLDQMFYSFSGHSSSTERAYVAAAQVIDRHDCSHVGLILGWDDWEHPLWRLIPEPMHRSRQIEHVAVANRSAALAKSHPEVTPCAILVGHVSVDSPIRLGGHSYSPSHKEDDLSVYLIDDTARQREQPALGKATK